MADAVDVDIECRFGDGPEIAARIAWAADAGSLLVLFGPSGAGKTTVLRTIAGLFRPQRGRIAVGGALWFDAAAQMWLPPQERRVGYVSQDPALFPHLSIRRNVEYASRNKAEARPAADALLRRLGVGEFAERRPRQLSGGQAQRVALARALAAEPRLLLLDEPFNALDAATRRQLRADVRTLLAERGARAILVTHDRLEAMALGDVVAVMVDGRVRQVGPTADVFRRPADPAAARALGVESVLPATVERDEGGLVALRVAGATLMGVADAPISPGERVFACVRGEDVVVEPRGTAAGSARNHVEGVVAFIEPEGPLDRVTIDCGGFSIVALITRRSREELELVPGSLVSAGIKATAIHVVRRL